jgi:hypothetical protein
MNINLEFEREYGNYMRPAEEQAKNDGNLNPLRQGWKRHGRGGPFGGGKQLLLE